MLWGKGMKSKPKSNRSDNGMLTVSEVADLLSVHPNTVRHWSDIGLLKCYRLGLRHDRRFKREDIDTFIKKATNT